VKIRPDCKIDRQADLCDQIPGNQYSIENEMDKPARLFFSQGCEPAPAEEEA